MLLSNLLFAVAVTLVAAGNDAPPATPLHTPSWQRPHAVIRPFEVRTRRLHVVRPDLLRFPIVYDTLC